MTDSNKTEEVSNATEQVHCSLVLAFDKLHTLSLQEQFDMLQYFFNKEQQRMANLLECQTLERVVDNEQ